MKRRIQNFLILATTILLLNGIMFTSCRKADVSETLKTGKKDALTHSYKYLGKAHNVFIENVYENFKIVSTHISNRQEAIRYILNFNKKNIDALPISSQEKQMLPEYLHHWEKWVDIEYSLTYPGVEKKQKARGETLQVPILIDSLYTIGIIGDLEREHLLYNPLHQGQ